jgi:hypothetical protein
MSKGGRAGHDLAAHDWDSLSRSALGSGAYVKGSVTAPWAQPDSCSQSKIVAAASNACVLGKDGRVSVA